MKAKLLKRLRETGRNQISVYSIRKADGVTIGMSYFYDKEEYSGLFEFGDTEQQVKDKAAKIFLLSNIDMIRSKYRKYSRKNKKSIN